MLHQTDNHQITKNKNIQTNKKQPNVRFKYTHGAFQTGICIPLQIYIILIRLVLDLYDIKKCIYINVIFPVLAFLRQVSLENVWKMHFLKVEAG